jgi:endonuclease IV
MDRLYTDELSEIMNRQAQVWTADTSGAQEVLLDTCHALAVGLALNDEQKTDFLKACGWTLVWGRAE